MDRQIEEGTDRTDRQTCEANEGILSRQMTFLTTHTDRGGRRNGTLSEQNSAADCEMQVEVLIFKRSSVWFLARQTEGTSASIPAEFLDGWVG